MAILRVEKINYGNVLIVTVGIRALVDDINIRSIPENN